MKTLLAGLGVAVALTLAGCAGSTSVITQADLIALQGDTSLDLAWNQATKAFLAQAKTLPPATHDAIKADLKKARTLVKAADAGQDVAANVAAALTLISQARSALPAQP